ncbi:MAG: helix-turn-helix transcriptional regulator [Clostridiales Family XIII bacterium]|jgi:putative transcriptional regulator|nr:helix-turn-helix transcriptional regulator [Clostridiales Family XIII bacterium]
MSIRVNLDVVMAQRRMSSGELAERIGVTPANLSILKNNKARAIRFSTLDELCRALRCQPGDILEFEPQQTPDGGHGEAE